MTTTSNTYNSQINDFSACASTKVNEVGTSAAKVFNSITSKVMNYVKENKQTVFFAVALFIFAYNAPLLFLAGTVAYHYFNIGEKSVSKEGNIFQNSVGNKQ